MIDPQETVEPWVDPSGPPPRPVNEAVTSFAAVRGWSRRLEGARIHGLWAEIAGERLACHTEPVRLHGGVLVVHATSTSWAAQIPYVASEIMARANQVLGEDAVTRVVVAQQRAGAPPRAPR